jgi:hypothetical protein
VSEEGGDGEGETSEAPSLLSYILRYVSFAEFGNMCQFGFREPMHLCVCVSGVLTSSILLLGRSKLTSSNNELLFVMKR